MEIGWLYSNLKESDELFDVDEEEVASEEAD